MPPGLRVKFGIIFIEPQAGSCRENDRLPLRVRDRGHRFESGLQRIRRALPDLKLDRMARSARKGKLEDAFLRVNRKGRKGAPSMAVNCAPETESLRGGYLYAHAATRHSDSLAVSCKSIDEFFPISFIVSHFPPLTWPGVFCWSETVQPTSASTASLASV